MNIKQNSNFGTHNTSVRTGAIEYIVIHYVGATGGAKANVEYYNQATTTNASADFYVDHNGDVYQYNPDPKARYCWAVGGKKLTYTKGGSLHGIVKNGNSVSIEMCVKNKGDKTANSPDWYFTEETIASTIELTKYLMGLYGIPAERVVRHYDVTGKFCPGVKGWNADSGSETEWESFKKTIVQEATSEEIYRVRKSWEDAKSQLGAFSSLDNAKAMASKNSGYSVYDSSGKKVYPAEAFKPFSVRVKIIDLNIRTGAGTHYAIVGRIPIGTYTIVEVKPGKGSDLGWGRLKSGAGWISLDFVERV